MATLFRREIDPNYKRGRNNINQRLRRHRQRLARQRQEPLQAVQLTLPVSDHLSHPAGALQALLGHEQLQA